MKKFSLIVFFSFFFLTGFCQLKSSFKSIRLVNGDSLDFSQQDGSVYLNQTTGQFRFRENGVWKGLGSGGGGMSIDSARIYDSLSVLRDSVDDISNYVHGLSQDYWPLSGSFSTSGAQGVTLGGNIQFSSSDNFNIFGGNHEFTSTGLSILSGGSGVSGTYYDFGLLASYAIDANFSTAQGIIIDSLNVAGRGQFLSLTAFNENPNRPGFQIYNSGIMTDSSAINKRYADTHLGGETFTPPSAGNDGQSIRWSDTGGEWEYYTPGSGGGVSETYVAESIDTARTYADDNFWPLSGNFSTSGAQTITRNGALVMNGTQDFTIRYGTTSGYNALFATNGVLSLRGGNSASLTVINDDSINPNSRLYLQAAVSDSIGITLNVIGEGEGTIYFNPNDSSFSITADNSLNFTQARMRGARAVQSNQFVTKAQLDSVAALITMDISPNSLELNKAVFDYKLLLLLCGVFIMGYYAHRNGYKRI